MATRQTQWSTEQARRILADHQRSGLSLPEFARRRGLRTERLRRWQAKFSDEVSAAAPRMVELVAVGAPVTGIIRLCCPSGHVVEIEEVGLTEGLRAVLSALPEGAPC